MTYNEQLKEASKNRIKKMKILFKLILKIVLYNPENRRSLPVFPQEKKPPESK